MRGLCSHCPRAPRVRWVRAPRRTSRCRLDRSSQLKRQRRLDCQRARHHCPRARVFASRNRNIMETPRITAKGGLCRLRSIRNSLYQLYKFDPPEPRIVTTGPRIRLRVGYEHVQPPNAGVSPLRALAGPYGCEVTKCTGVETLCLPPLWVKICAPPAPQHLRSWTRRPAHSPELSRGAAQGAGLARGIFFYHGHTGEQGLMT